ncbi:hypothetical protein PWYN_03190 [Paenibacillus wynnii]|uniref:HTH cro/C1-type domain-containing protein n=1 Tax=Paenibacillus wynnii TaxID=268407 RepID=A0A098M7D4_9BACL|nr:hypothetical protein PWYN_03190 [Paenibacillus wynnii]
MNFSENLRIHRERMGISKSELARRVGVSDVTVGHWEIGKISPRMGKVEMIADVLGVTTDDLIFGENTSKKPVNNSIPLFGSIAAGAPLEMIKAEEYLEIPEYISQRYPGAFLLRIKGDSMNKVIPTGAYALIVPCLEVTNGEIAVVSINGDEATLKRFYKLQNTIVLEPDSYNPEHKANSFTSDDSKQLRILGRMVWYMAPFDQKF